MTDINGQQFEPLDEFEPIQKCVWCKTLFIIDSEGEIRNLNFKIYDGREYGICDDCRKVQETA